MILTKHNASLIPYRTAGEASRFSRALLPEAVREYCASVGAPPKEVVFLPNGKPVFADFPGHFLSVTHTGDLLLFAFAPVPIGVDAEKKTEERPRVAARYFTETERLLPFAAVWTAREAVAKLSGGGLSDALRVTVSGNTALLDGRTYSLFTAEYGEYLVTIAEIG